VDNGAPRGSTRDNGLRCANYAAIAELDPRVVDALLTTLRDAGIAAYAVPASGTVGGAMELQLPSRPVDRLWVDDSQVARAREIVADEQREQPAPGTGGVEPVTATQPAGTTPAGTESLDLDAAWQQVLASLQSGSSSPVPPWPVSEDYDGADADPAGRESEETEGGDPAEDEHFVPPPPPPFPRPQPATLGAVLSIAAGLVVLALQFDGGSLTALAILAILGGVASLVWRMRNGPPTDSGWDDGAVL
jgi:hypothetical protein